MSLPNGPKNLSLIQTLQFFFRPLETLDAWHKQYGDTFRVLGNELPATIFFSSPEAIRKIFTSDSEYLTCSRKNNLLTLVLGENSLLFLNGEQHQRQKRILMPPFHSERIREYSQIVCEVTEQAILQLAQGEIFTVYSFMKQISLRIVINVLFGLEMDNGYEKLQEVLNSLFELFHHPLNLVSLSFFTDWQKKIMAMDLESNFKNQRQQVEEIIRGLITERRRQANSLRTDVLTMLLEAHDEFGKPITETELCDSLLTLMFAGYETTASAISWALYWSHYLPEVKQNLLCELSSFLPHNDKSELVKLPYLSAVCSETLRLYPISLSSFSRFVQKPMEILGYQLEPETVVNVSIYLAHHREEVYPEPKFFKPERFLERQFSPYEYLPFGGGNYRCIGAALAQLEIKLVLATLLSRLQLRLVTTRPLKPIRRGLLMTPPTNFEMIVTGVY